MREVAPCKDCADRHLACHDSCEKYKAWKERYHAQQKHFEENRYRMEVPMSPARAKAIRNYSYDMSKYKRRGDQ